MRYLTLLAVAIAAVTVLQSCERARLVDGEVVGLDPAASSEIEDGGDAVLNDEAVCKKCEEWAEVHLLTENEAELECDYMDGVPISLPASPRGWIVEVCVQCPGLEIKVTLSGDLDATTTIKTEYHFLVSVDKGSERQLADDPYSFTVPEANASGDPTVLTFTVP